MRLFSPDYEWEWNGTEWVPAQQPVFSPDGQHLWVGERWIPVPPSHEPVSETRPPQLIESFDIRQSGPQERDDDQNVSPPLQTDDEHFFDEIHSLNVEHDAMEGNDANIETLEDEEPIAIHKPVEIIAGEMNDENNDEDEEHEIHDVDLAGWEIAVVGQDVDGNRIELFDEVRDVTVSNLLRTTAEYIEEIPLFFGDGERQIFMVTLYLLPPRHVFFPSVEEHNGTHVIEALYRCTIDEFWQKKVIDRTANGSLYLPNLHFIWYSDAHEISAEGHFGFDSIRQQDLDIQLKIPSISTSDIMQLIVWLVNGKYELIKQHHW